MTNVVLQKIYEFNQKAGLLDDGFDDKREAEYIIEEALEKFDISYLNKKLLIEESSTAREASRAIVTGMCSLPEEGITKVDQLDKLLDQTYFAVGAMFKLGLSKTDIMRGLDVVCNANLAKLSAGKDSAGKQLKPEGWIPPEEFLEQILKDSKCSTT